MYSVWTHSLKEAPKMPGSPCRYSMCLRVTFVWWTITSFHSGCINSYGWWESYFGHTSLWLNIMSVRSSNHQAPLKPALEAEWCKCLELPLEKVLISQCRMIWLYLRQRWWGADGESVDSSGQSITCWSLDVPTKSTFFHNVTHVSNSTIPWRDLPQICVLSPLVLLCKRQFLSQEEKIIYDRVSHIFLGV